MRVATVLLVACASSGRVRGPATTDSAAPVDSAPIDSGADCPEGTWCNPIGVGPLPWTDARDTRAAPGPGLDRYACAPTTDESGEAFVYRVDVAEPGVLLVAVEDDDATDVDVHLLRAPEDADACVVRDDRALRWWVEPGTWYLVVDTWVDGEGVASPGPFTLSVDLASAPAGRCALVPRDLRMHWADCAPGIDCDVSDVPVLHTPSAGPVVLEAHLVTDAESFPGGWPESARDGIEAHYALSEAATGWRLDRDQPWAPEGEGGSHWGGGATGRPVPVLDEAWYVNMYWRDRPDRGTRMLVWDPATGRAVVASGGYETGPGSNTAIGGAVEEIHRYLQTGHRESLVMGFLADASLPLGPIDCP